MDAGGCGNACRPTATSVLLLLERNVVVGHHGVHLVAVQEVGLMLRHRVVHDLRVRCVVVISHPLCAMVHVVCALPVVHRRARRARVCLLRHRHGHGMQCSHRHCKLFEMHLQVLFR